MLQLTTRPYLTDRQLKKKLTEQTDLRLFRYWQIIHAVQHNKGKKAEELSALLGVPKTTVYRVLEFYNKQGPGFEQKLVWGGRRETRSLMPVKEEKEMLEKIAQQASEGKLLTAKAIKKIVEQQVGRKVSDDYLWDLFKRHKWKKKSPRPQHPLHNQAQQEEFKKNSPSYWHPATD